MMKKLSHNKLTENHQWRDDEGETMNSTHNNNDNKLSKNRFLFNNQIKSQQRGETSAI